MSSRRRAGASCDLEELRPGRFVLHNPAVAPVLRGEGERIGDRFELQSERVEGLLARVRMRGYRVLTLGDQIAALPAVPHAPASAAGLLQLQTGDRLSRFAAAEPGGWQELVPEADGRYHLPVDTVIRRRQGRGPARYALVISGGLRTLAADEAILLGYARTPPAAGVLTIAADGWRLAALVLPTDYRALLPRWAEALPDGGWAGVPATQPLIEQMLARLGRQR